MIAWRKQKLDPQFDRGQTAKRACTVTNMLVSDYGGTIGKYGIDRSDLWADLAHDFPNNGDAVPGKTDANERFIAEKS